MSLAAQNLTMATVRVVLQEHPSLSSPSLNLTRNMITIAHATLQLVPRGLIHWPHVAQGTKQLPNLLRTYIFFSAKLNKVQFARFASKYFDFDQYLGISDNLLGN
jgi:hypothetical protein